jgi:hypothetical protein
MCIKFEFRDLLESSYLIDWCNGKDNIKLGVKRKRIVRKRMQPTQDNQYSTLLRISSQLWLVM